MTIAQLANYDCTAVILAGGQARRFNGIDKGLLPLQNKPLVSHIQEKLPSNWPIIISTHGNSANYQTMGFECIDDISEDYLGPMIAIPHIAQSIQTEYFIVSACDTPLIPSDVYLQLLQTIKAGTRASFAKTTEREHYCCLVAETAAVKAIKAKPRSMRDLLKMLKAKACELKTDEALFKNINQPSDLIF